MQGWLFPSTNGRLVIFVAGVTQNRTNPSYGTMMIAHEVAQQGYGILMYDSRAHGESGGNQVTLGQLESQDLLQIVSFVKQQGYAPHHIAIIADSLGAISTMLVH